MKVRFSPRLAATFLAGWAAGGGLMAIALNFRMRDSLAYALAATDRTIALSLEASFDEARSAFWLAMGLGVALPLILLALGHALVAGARAGRRGGGRG